MLALNSLFDRHISTELEIQVIQGYFRAAHLIWNKKEKSTYNKAQRYANRENPTPPKIENEPQSNVVSSRKKGTTYFRDNTTIADMGKFNLASFHELSPDSVRYKYLYGRALELIHTLYKHLPFWKTHPHFAEEILDRIIHNKQLTFCNLFSEDPKKHQLFYTLLKGTNTYKAGSSKGIAPFLNYFKLDDSQKDLDLNFIYVPRITLEILLGETLMKQVEGLEKATNKALTKESFNTLLQNFPQEKTDLENIRFLFKKTGKNLMSKTDKATQITLFRQSYD
jgi:hypothetical protein